MNIDQSFNVRAHSQFEYAKNVLQSLPINAQSFQIYNCWCTGINAIYNSMAAAAAAAIDAAPNCQVAATIELLQWKGQPAWSCIKRYNQPPSQSATFSCALVWCCFLVTLLLIFFVTLWQAYGIGLCCGFEYLSSIASNWRNLTGVGFKIAVLLSEALITQLICHWLLSHIVALELVPLWLRKSLQNVDVLIYHII